MRWMELRFVLTVIAVVETLYAVAGLFTPPSMMVPVTGWVLSADGQWIAKLLGAALGSQALVAWSMRDKPHYGVVYALVFYQVAAATVDWVMWLALLDEGIFSTSLSRVSVAGSVVLHYSLGILLLIAARRAAGSRFKQSTSRAFISPQRHAAERQS